MTYIAFCILLLVGAIAFFFAGKFMILEKLEQEANAAAYASQGRNQGELMAKARQVADERARSLERKILVSLPFVLLVVSFFSSFTTIGTGQIGVVRTFGLVDTVNLLGEGAHFVLPWQTVFTVDNRTTKTSLDKPAEAASHDMQAVHTNIAVNWRIDPLKVGTVLHQFGIAGDGGGEALTEKVVVPSILETFKSVISQYTAEELVTRRAEVSTRITEYLTKKLAQYDLLVETTNLTDFQFSQQFNAAIEAKVTATQAALKAEQDLKRVKIEADQRIAQAEGEAKAIQIQAQAIKSQGGAEYVQLQAIHKWNGELPTMILGEKSVPFINVAKR